jgi:gas vesicle protein
MWEEEKPFILKRSKAMRHEGRFSDTNLFLPFIIGGIVGGSLALLLAPKSGSKTRQKIKDFPGGMKSALSKAVAASKKAYEKEILIRYLKRLANRA